LAPKSWKGVAAIRDIGRGARRPARVGRLGGRAAPGSGVVARPRSTASGAAGRPGDNPRVATYRLTLEYDGTRYRGWQEQQNARSVTGELRSALASVTDGVREIGGSGRTDAGVHALAQVAHLRLAQPIDPETLRWETNAVLPADIHLLAVERAPSTFHARHEAVARTYLYQISRRRTAFAKRFVWWVKQPLEVDLLRESAQRIVGRHDFRRFCERPGEQPSTVVVVEAVEVATEGELILVRFRASHFLWKMVRRLTGGLVRVAGGELPAEDFALLFERPGPPTSGSDSPAAWTAPPSGLFLERVDYPGDPPLGRLRSAVPVTPEPARGRTS
jgi:tRNA pseudouridine38-40 synthase